MTKAPTTSALRRTTAIEGLLKRDPFGNEPARFGAGRFGLWLFLASLGVLFAATLVALVFIRILNRETWPTDLPSLPSWLWLSTVILIISSGVAQGALFAIERDRRRRCTLLLGATLLLGLAFLAMQSVSWLSWFRVVGPRWEDAAPYRFALSSFYVLTGLHAAHVIGGLIPMVVVTLRAAARRYDREHYAGVFYVVVYWHFLGAVWLVLFFSLLVTT